MTDIHPAVKLESAAPSPNPGPGPETKPESEVKEGPKLAPEGGLRGWLCVLGAFFGIFNTFGFLNAYALPRYFKNYPKVHR